MVQKEVAEKLASDAKKKSYLRRLINNFYEVEYLFTVSANSFSPPPKVESAVIKLTIQNTKLKTQKYQKMLQFLDVIR